MRKKYKKILSFIIPVLMLVSVMHFENFKMDFLFVCESAETANSYKISSEDSIITNQNSHNTQMFGIIGQPDRLTRLCSYQSRNTKQFCDFLPINILSLNEGKFYLSPAQMQNITPNQKELVASYIHKTDGKKRI